jgi:hypothetical protein
MQVKLLASGNMVNTALSLLWTQDPKEEKFRKIRLSNAAFQTRVASMNGALKFLELVGFQKEDDSLLMPAEKASADTLNAAGGELNNACTNPFFGVLWSRSREGEGWIDLDCNMLTNIQQNM